MDIARASRTRDDKLNNHNVAIREGLTKIRSTGAEIVLIDPQFAPKVIVKPEAMRMVELMPALSGMRMSTVSPASMWEALARSRPYSGQDVHVPQRTTHERLELWLLHRLVLKRPAGECPLPYSSDQSMSAFWAVEVLPRS